MRTGKENHPNGQDMQQRKEQPKVGGAGVNEPYESETGRKGASENIAGTEQPGEEKDTE